MTSLISRAELEAAGVSRLEIDHRLTSGVLHKVRRGFYASGTVDGSAAHHLLAVRAAGKTMHPGAVFSHLSAVVLHGLPLPAAITRVDAAGVKDGAGVVEVTRHGVSGGRRTSSVFLHKAPLLDGDVVNVEGLLVTSLERTAVDVARRWSRVDALAVVDAALNRGADLNRIVDAVRGRRSHGNVRARWVVDFADGLSESYYESLTRLRMHEQGVPRPELQYEIRTADGEILGRSDFAWPKLGVLGEFDGATKYGLLRRPGQAPGQVLAAEKRREERICQQGWWFARFTAGDCHRPDGVRQIWEQAVLARRGGVG